MCVGGSMVKSFISFFLSCFLLSYSFLCSQPAWANIQVNEDELEAAQQAATGLMQVLDRAVASLTLLKANGSYAALDTLRKMYASAQVVEHYKGNSNFSDVCSRNDALCANIQTVLGWSIDAAWIEEYLFQIDEGDFNNLRNVETASFRILSKLDVESFANARDEISNTVAQWSNSAQRKRLINEALKEHELVQDFMSLLQIENALLVLQVLGDAMAKIAHHGASLQGKFAKDLSL